MNKEQVTIAQVDASTFCSSALALVSDGRLSAEASDVLGDFLAESKRRNLTSSEMGKALGVSPSTVSRVFRCVYEGDFASIAKRAGAALRLWRERATRGEVFVETTIARQVRSACDFAVVRQTPVILTGLSQMGKTTALVHYAAAADIPVHILRIGAAANLGGTLDELAGLLGVSATRERLRRRIASALSDRHLLIIDELHELVMSATKSQALRIAESIREIYDRSRCGLVLCGTDTLTTDFLGGPSAGWLDQIVQRSVSVRLPRRLSLEDVEGLARAYGLKDPLPDVLKPEVLTMRTNRIRLLCEMSRDAAIKQGCELDWSLFLRTKSALLG